MNKPAAILVLLLTFAAVSCSGGGGQREDWPELPTDTNLVVNPGFEQWRGSMPVGWTLKQVLEEGGVSNHHGRSDKGSIGEFSFYLAGDTNTKKWMIATQTFPVSPGYTVFFSADIMTEDLKRLRTVDPNAHVQLWFYDENGEMLEKDGLLNIRTRTRGGTSSWKRDSRKIKVPDDARTVEIGLVSLMTGTIYFDDVKLFLRKNVEWEEKDTGYITFHWLPERPFPDDEMDRVAGMIEDIAKEAKIEKPEKKIKYYLYPDEATYMRILEKKEYRTAAWWSEKQLHTVDTFNDHEMIHLILYDLGMPPVVLAKGFVFYFRSKYNDWDLHIRSKRFLMQQKIPALHNTIDLPSFQKTDPAIMVPAWGSFVTYLVDTHGIEKFKEFYERSDEKVNFEELRVIFEDLYETDFDEADRAWRFFLVRYEGDPRADTLPNQ
jgi:hypothetical protein